MLRSRVLWTLAVVLGLSAAPLFAQGGAGSTGNIQGDVVDESGGVLPGVTVTATGDRLLTPQSAITSQSGGYRLLGLPAGTYTLTFEMPGFGKVVREDIRIGIGFTANVNIKLGVKAMEETLTVVGESPAIDTTATRVQTNFDLQQLEALPNARDMWSLLAETPAIQLNRFDVGGSTAGTQTTYTAYGNGGQNRPLIEGINTTEGTSAAGFYFDYGSFQEVIVGAAANSAEMPSGGVLTNFVGKSGGNAFHGEAYFEYESPDVQSTNVTQDQLNRGFANIPKSVIQSLDLNRDQANTLLDYKNLNLSLGGPIVKDKLWLWAGYLRQQNIVYQPATGNILDGTEFLTKLENWTGKVTYQMTSRDKFTAYIQYGTKNQPYRTDANVGSPQHTTVDSTLNQGSPSWVGKVEYNRTFGNRGFLEVRAGEFGYNFALVGNGNDPRREDTTTLVVTGGGRDWQLDRRRKQLHGAYTFFADNWLGGEHQLKVGGEVQHETGRTRWNSYFADNVVQFFNNGAPSFVRLGLEVDSKNGLRNYGLFANDTYTRGRLTVNFGLRYDRYRVFLPEQERPASRFSAEARSFEAVDNLKTFNHIAPRIGVIVDLTKDGKTLLKANYGRYYFNPGVNLADATNPNTSTQYTQYAWTDRNGDRLWQQGEQGALQAQFGGSANVLIDPNLRNSYTNEFSTWLEREFGGQIGVRAGFVWKMDRDGYQQSNQNRPLSAYNVPITVVDPGADGTRGTSDDGLVSMNNLNPANLALPVVNFVSNPAGGFEADYKSIELAVNKRFSRRYSVVSSFLYTWTQEWGSSYFSGGAAGIGGSLPSLFSGFAAQVGFPITDADLKNTRAEFTSWNFKLHGTYEPGWGMRLTPVLRAQQGLPYGRVFTATSTSGPIGQPGVNYGTQPFAAQPLTANRNETVTIFDFRAEKTLNLGSKVKLGLLFDVFNIFNANTELNIRYTTGRIAISETGANIPAFQTPVSILPPRIARFSARLSF